MNERLTRGNDRSLATGNLNEEKGGGKKRSAADFKKEEGTFDFSSVLEFKVFKIFYSIKTWIFTNKKMFFESFSHVNHFKNYIRIGNK